MRHVEIFTGARSCGDSPAASAWALDLVDGVLRDLPNGSLVVVGDARGLDAFVLDRAQALGFVVRRFALDGWTYEHEDFGDARPLWQWGPCDVPAYGTPERKRWPLDRNDAMVRYVAQCVASGDTAHVTGAIVGPSRGTRYTINAAARAGLTTCAYEMPDGAGP